MKLTIMALLVVTQFGCVSGTFTGAVYMKRDRFGESPVTDMRDMVSLNEKRFERKK